MRASETQSTPQDQRVPTPEHSNDNPQPVVESVTDGFQSPLYATPIDGSVNRQAAAIQRLLDTRPHEAHQMMLRLQRQYGNQYVQRMMASRLAPPNPFAHTEKEEQQFDGSNWEDAVLFHDVAESSPRQSETRPVRSNQRAEAYAAHHIIPIRSASPANQVQPFLGGLIEGGKKWLFEKALGLAGVPKQVVMGLINRAGSVVSQIIADPGAFVNNLIGAVKQGFEQFVGNIGTHLKRGLLSWLFGALSSAGIQLPKDFSVKSIFGLILQVLGVTVDILKQKLAKFIGAKNVQRLEKAWSFVSTLISSGLGGIWDLVQNTLGNLKELIFDEIKDWVIVEIIKSAVIKVVSMFNPVSGLITIIQTIYRVVKFLIERASQLASLFQAIAGSVIEIATGSIGAAAGKVEEALGRAIPVAIGFLASLLGLGGIADKIKGIIRKIQSKVNNAIDSAMSKVAAKVKKLLGKEEKKDPQKSTKLDLQHPFNMSREGHHLYATVKGGKLVVEMASGRRGNLEVLVQNAIRDEEKGAKRQDLLQSLMQAKHWLKEMKWEWNASSGKNDGERREQAKKAIETVAGVLQGIGVQYGIPDLATLGHPSVYVEADQLKPEYHSTVRAVFYPSGYNAATTAWFNKRLNELKNPANPKEFKDEMTGQWEPIEEATIDHKTRVVEHWSNGGGNNMSQAERSQFYNDTSSMQIVARKNNSSDGAMARNMGLRYIPTVGPKFRGPKDKDT